MCFDSYNFRGHPFLSQESILSKARAKVDSSETLTPHDQQELKDVLGVKRDLAAKVFNRLESEKEEETKKLTDKLQAEEK